MLEVKVILHNANTGAVTEIGNLRIVNDGTGNPPGALGNYDVEGWDDPRPPLRSRNVLRGRVVDYPRRMGLSVWILVKSALEACVQHALEDWLPEQLPPCATCDGTGQLALPVPSVCTDCGGSGRQL